MPEIIKHGDTVCQPLYSYVGMIHTCITCKCVFKITRDDRLERYEPATKDTWKRCYCPECGETIYW